MTEQQRDLVFDTGPLSHFAKQGWLGILRAVLNGRRAIVPDTVVAELRAGMQSRPYLQLVLDAPWIEQHDLATAKELQEFAAFSALLVAEKPKRRRGRRTRIREGQQCHGDHRRRARAKGRPGSRCLLPGRLGLLCDALHAKLLTIELISIVADHLLESEYRLPFQPGGFERWARDNGLVPPSA